VAPPKSGAVADVAGIEVVGAVEFPPCPTAIGLVGAEPIAQQMEHVSGEERLRAHDHHERRCGERPVIGTGENVEGER
jgi:hypothetical protein